MKNSNMYDICLNIIESIKLIESIKSELRHSWLSNGRQESVAEHSWRLAMLLMFCTPHLQKNIDFSKALKMALIHDVVESISGDVHFMSIIEGTPSAQHHADKERYAINQLRALFNNNVGNEIYALWNEFDQQSTYEARIVLALDKLEAHIQHNEANINTWVEPEVESLFGYFDKYCDFEPLFKSMKFILLEESIKKINLSNSPLKKYIKNKVSSSQTTPIK